MIESGSSPEDGRETADEVLPFGPADGVSAGGGAEPTDIIEPVPSLPPAGSAEAILEALPAPPLGDLDEFAELPVVIRVARPPHPSFWWAVLWCGLFLIVTQIIPSIVIVVALILPEMLQSQDFKTGPKGIATNPGEANGREPVNRSDDEGTARGSDTKEKMEELQRKALLPSLLASQVLGIAFSCLALRLVAGRSWRRQVALRLPSLSHLVLALVGFPALPILASGAYALAKQELPGLPEVLPFLGTEVFMLGAFWLVLRLTAGAHWNQDLARRPAPVQLLFVFVGVVVIVLSTAGVYGLITQSGLNLTLPFDTGIMEKMVKEFRNWPWPVGVLIIGLGPGLAEELWCRGFLGRGLVGHYGVPLGVLLTSFLFGLIHGDPHQGTMAMLMGITLHFAYVTTRSLLVPMLLHFLNNALSVLGDKIGSGMEKIDTNPEDISWVLYVVSALLMIVVGWALYRTRARLAAVDGNGPPAWRPAFPSVALPPPGTNTVVVHPRLEWEGWLLVLAAAAGFGYVAWLTFLV